MKEEELRLVELEPEHEAAFWEFLEALRTEGNAEHWLPEYQGEPYAEVAEKLKCWKTGKKLPQDWVSASTFFLMRDGKFVGRVSIRHQLNEALRSYGGHIGYCIRLEERGKGYGTEILRLALEETRKLGLRRVLITCDDQGNPASARIIEKNGGLLADKVQNEGKPCLTRRYWIDLEKENR